MSSALIEHLKQQDDAVIAYTSSILGPCRWCSQPLFGDESSFASLRVVAALPSEGHGHPRAGNGSRCMRTDLMNNREAEQAMQLDQLIVETMAVFAADADEMRPFRANLGPKEHAFIDAFNAQMLTVTQNNGPLRIVWGKFDCDVGDLSRRSLRPPFTECGATRWRLAALHRRRHGWADTRCAGPRQCRWRSGTHRQSVRHGGDRLNQNLTADRTAEANAALFTKEELSGGRILSRSIWCSATGHGGSSAPGTGAHEILGASSEHLGRPDRGRDRSDFGPRDRQNRRRCDRCFRPGTSAAQSSVSHFAESWRRRISGTSRGLHARFCHDTVNNIRQWLSARDGC